MFVAAHIFEADTQQTIGVIALVVLAVYCVLDHWHRRP